MAGVFNVKSDVLKEKAKSLEMSYNNIVSLIEAISKTYLYLYERNYWTGRQAARFYSSAQNMFLIEHGRDSIANMLKNKSKDLSNFLIRAAVQLEQLEYEIEKGIQKPLISALEATPSTISYASAKIEDLNDVQIEKVQKSEAEKEIASSNPKLNSTGNYGNLDMVNYNKNVWIRDANGNRIKYDDAAAKERAVLVAKYLVQNGGLTKAQAAAVVGVYWDENHVDPGEVMSAEKKANKNSYGAGIASWTNQDYKNQCLKDAGLPANTPIENLSLQQQCDMVIAMTNGRDKRYYDALKRCETVEDASATAVIITGGVGHSNNWSTHPTPQDARNMSEWYARRNDQKYGYSENHHNLDGRRLAYAKEILKEL